MPPPVFCSRCEAPYSGQGQLDRGVPPDQRRYAVSFFDYIKPYAGDRYFDVLSEGCGSAPTVDTVWPW